MNRDDQWQRGQQQFALRGEISKEMEKMWKGAKFSLHVGGM